MDELRFMTQARYLGIKSLLYRPFLYYAIHHHDRSVETNQVIVPLVQKALISTTKRDKGPRLCHRHHGTWLVARKISTDCLLLLAAKKSGLISFNAESIFASGCDFVHAFSTYLEALKYWEWESPDIVRARQVIEELQDDIGAQT